MNHRSPSHLKVSNLSHGSCLPPRNQRPEGRVGRSKCCSNRRLCRRLWRCSVYAWSRSSFTEVSQRSFSGKPCSSRRFREGRKRYWAVGGRSSEPRPYSAVICLSAFSMSSFAWTLSGECMILFRCSHRSNPMIQSCSIKREAHREPERRSLGRER